MSKCRRNIVARLLRGLHDNVIISDFSGCDKFPENRKYRVGAGGVSVAQFADEWLADWPGSERVSVGPRTPSARQILRPRTFRLATAATASASI